MAVEALEKLAVLPGAYPHFPARSFALVSETGSNGYNGEPWMNSTLDANYVWKGTTSSNEIDGTCAIYPLFVAHVFSQVILLSSLLFTIISHNRKKRKIACIP